MQLFFDLDGTLIDSRLRLYTLFQNLIPQSNFSFDQYWDLKRNKVDHSRILQQYFNFSEEDIFIFQNKWMLLIESEKYLELDKPFPGVLEFLISLNKKNELYLITARQFKDKTLNQIENLGWSKLFIEILVTEQKVKKSELIKTVISNNTSGWMLGDTGIDIISGKQLGLKTVAVLTGFLSERILLTYSPDIIIKEVINFKI